VSAFLSSQDGAGGGRKQIISLGAGTDTRPFRLFSKPGTRRLVYHEADFPATVNRKRRIIQSVPVLRSLIPLTEDHQQGSTSEGVTNSSNWAKADLPNDCSYFCHGLDLRDLVDNGPPPPPPPGSPAPPTAAPQPPASTPALLHGIEPDLPTLLISECCLCYLEPSQARSVVRYFASRLANLSLVLYEPIRPADPFGRQMVANLAARRIRMPTLTAYPDVAEQRARLTEAGLADGVRALTVRDIWASWVAADEKERVDQLEGLDEVEEWDLLASHYVIAWAWRGQGFEGSRDV
jgi:[phosphatase 2A protein]-leucine-carboxy methyltransferase